MNLFVGNGKNLILVLLCIISLGCFGAWIRLKRKPSTIILGMLIFLSILDGALAFIGCLFLFSLKALPVLVIIVFIGSITVFILSFYYRKQ